MNMTCHSFWFLGAYCLGARAYLYGMFLMDIPPGTNLFWVLELWYLGFYSDGVQTSGYEAASPLASASRSRSIISEAKASASAS